MTGGVVPPCRLRDRSRRRDRPGRGRPRGGGGPARPPVGQCSWRVPPVSGRPGFRAEPAVSLPHRRLRGSNRGPGATPVGEPFSTGPAIVAPRRRASGRRLNNRLSRIPARLVPEVNRVVAGPAGAPHAPAIDYMGILPRGGPTVKGDADFGAPHGAIRARLSTLAVLLPGVVPDCPAMCLSGVACAAHRPAGAARSPARSAATAGAAGHAGPMRPRSGLPHRLCHPPSASGTRCSPRSGGCLQVHLRHRRTVGGGLRGEALRDLAQLRVGARVRLHPVPDAGEAVRRLPGSGPGG